MFYLLVSTVSAFVNELVGDVIRMAPGNWWKFRVDSGCLDSTAKIDTIHIKIKYLLNKVILLRKSTWGCGRKVKS